MGIKLKLNKIIIVSIFLLTLLTIGAASAEDLAAEDLTSDEVVDVVSLEDTDSADSSDGDEIIKDTQSYETLKDTDKKNCTPTVPISHFTFNDDKYDYEGFEVEVNAGGEELYGTLIIKVDDVQVYQTPISWNNAHVDKDHLNITDYKIHNLQLVYEGDGHFNGFVYNMTCEMMLKHGFLYIGVIDDDIDYYPEYGYDNYRLIFYVRNNVYHNATMTLVDENGKTYTGVWDESESYIFNLGKQGYGLHTYNVTAPSVGEIPAKTYIYEYNLKSFIKCPDSWDTSYGGKNNISLMLPEDAKGNLIVTVDGKVNNASFVNGNANVELELDLGQHTIEAYYEGDDYNVDQFNDWIAVYPKVKCKSIIADGDDIFIEVFGPLNFTTTCELTFFKYVDYDWQEVETVSFEIKNGYGNYTVSDYSNYVFVYDDYDDEGYNAVTFKPSYNSGEIIDQFYTVAVLDKPREGYLKLYIDEYYYKFLQESVYMRYSLPRLASGTVGVFIDDKFVKNITAGYSVKIDNLKEYDLGKHTIELKYYGNEYYYKVSNSTEFTLLPFQVFMSYSSYMDEPLEMKIIDDELDSGYFIIHIDGEEKDVKFASKEKIISLENLTWGKHNCTVAFSGNDKYDACNWTCTIDIRGYENSVGITIDSDGNSIVEVSISEKATGTVTLELYNGDTGSFIDNYTQSVINGKALFILNDLPDGYYEGTLYYNGDDKCPKFQLDDNAYFEKHKPSPVIKVTDTIQYGENAYVTVVFPDDFEGKLTITVDSTEIYSKTNPRGPFNYSIEGLGYGEHYVDVVLENQNYNIYSIYTSVYVGYSFQYPDDPEVEIGSNTTISLNVPSEINGTVHIIWENFDDYSLDGEIDIPLVNGNASWSFDGLNIGTYYISASLEGDYFNRVIPLGRSFMVTLPINLEIPENMTVGEDKYAVVTLPEGVTGSVTLLFENYEYDASSPVSLAELPIDVYRVTFRYSGNKGEYEMTMGPPLFVFGNAPTADVEVNDNKNGFTILLDEDATGEYLLDVDGVKYYANLTGAKTNVGIDNLQSGDYKVTLYYSGDKKYVDSKTSKTLTVVKPEPKATSITITMINGLELTGVLKDEDGHFVAEKTVRYSYEGANSSVLTNANGEFTIPVISNCIVTMTFEGDEEYNATSTVITLKNIVPRYLGTQIDLPTTITRTAVDFKAGEKGSMFYFTLMDENGKKLANKAVKIGIFDKIYTVKTDKNGRAGLEINIANANYYTYGISFLGDDEYKASFAVCSLQVVKKQVTITPAKTSYSFKASAKTKTVTATLKSTNSYIPKGKQVTLTIAGKTFKTTIGDKGQISFNIGSITKKGTYNVAVKFAGTNTYSAATSKTITIKLT